MVYTTYCI